jgi:hypothetical protein
VAETVFRDSRWNARVGLHVAVLPAVAVTLVLYLVLLPVGEPAAGQDPLAVVLVAGALLAYVGVWVRAQRATVVVSPDGIAVRNPFATRTIPLDGVETVAKQYTPATRCVAAVYRDPSGRRRKVSLVAVPERQMEEFRAAVAAARNG